MSALENLNKKAWNKSLKMVRNRGYIVPRSVETVEDLNKLVSKDGYRVVFDQTTNSDILVTLYQHEKLLSEAKVYIDTGSEKIMVDDQ